MSKLVKKFIDKAGYPVEVYDNEVEWPFDLSFAASYRSHLIGKLKYKKLEPPEMKKTYQQFSDELRGGE